MHFLLAFWLGLFAGVFSFFTVLIVTGRVAEEFLGYSQLLELFIFLIAAVAGTYACARIAKETPLFASACLGIPLAFFMFIGFTVSMGTPDWYFQLRGTLILLGSVIGYLLGTPRALTHIRIWLKHWHAKFTARIERLTVRTRVLNRMRSVLGGALFVVVLVCFTILVSAAILTVLLSLFIYAFSSFT